MNMFIILFAIAYLIYYLFFTEFKVNNIDTLLQRIMFNIRTIMFFAIGILFLLLFNENLIFIIYIIYSLLLLLHIIIPFLINLGIKLVNLMFKSSVSYTKGFKLKINSLALVSYLSILLAAYIN